MLHILWNISQSKYEYEHNYSFCKVHSIYTFLTVFFDPDCRVLPCGFKPILVHISILPDANYSDGALREHSEVRLVKI